MVTIKKLSLVSIIYLFGCASTGFVLSEYDQSVDFNNYNTFVICLDDLYVENIDYPKFDNNRIRQVIGHEIEVQMKDKGHITNVEDPQLQAGFRIVIEQKADTFKNCNINNEYGYWKNCTIHNIKYTEETLVVYVSDLAKNQVIWQASITCNLNRPAKELNSYVHRIVEDLYDKYPIL
jgi:hypothetical protein